MVTLSYTISPALLRSLGIIEELRKQILLIPLAPKVELRLQFEAMINRIHAGLLIDGIQTTSDEIQKVLTNQISLSIKPVPKQTSKVSLDQPVLQYKHGFDYLQQEWLVNPASITTADILKLHERIGDGKLKVTEKQLQEILDYLQMSKDNPIVQAAVAKLLFVYLQPFTQGNNTLSNMLAYMFLYKAGMDFRKMLVLEKAWSEDLVKFKKQYEDAVYRPTATAWLEYFADTISLNLLSTLDKVKAIVAEDGTSETDKFLEVTQRQKEILALFDDPNVVITNRSIQKYCKVSQITASRDLAKLTSVGLLFAHGKGRAVRYTKV